MDPDIEAIFREFRRIGFEPENVPGLAISGTPEEFIAQLREIPDGAGLEAFDALMRSLPQPESPAWNECPGLGPRFTPVEWQAAFLFINGEPTHLVEHVARHPTRTVFELALLWHGSPGVSARVDAYRADLRARRLAAGEADVADRADVEFETWKERHGSYLADLGEQDARVRGPIVWFRLATGLSPDAIDTIEAEVRDHAAPAWHVEINREEHPGDGSIQFRLGVDPADVERVHTWLERRPHVADAAIDWTQSGPPWNPFPRWDPYGDEED